MLVLVPHEPDGVSQTKGLQAYFSLAKAPDQKSARIPCVVLDRDIGQPLLAVQVPCESLGNFFYDSRVTTRGGTHTLIAQEAQQQPKRVRLPAAPLKASRSVLPMTALVPHDIILYSVHHRV